MEKIPSPPLERSSPEQAAIDKSGYQHTEEEELEEFKDFEDLDPVS